MSERIPNRLLEGADKRFREWSIPRAANHEHSRPFYSSYSEHGCILGGLRTFHGQNCDQMIKLMLREKGQINVLDICCGIGRAAAQVEQCNLGVSSYGLTGSTFYVPVALESAMQLADERLIIGNVAYLRQLMEEQLPGKKFDVIYSFQGLSYVPLPVLYMIEQIYSLLESGGVAFLEHWHSGNYQEVVGYHQLIAWLKKNGYDFEFDAGLGKDTTTVTIPRSAFKKTQENLTFPVEFTSEGLSIFKILAS